MEQKPIRTFTLCDETGTKYEINEFAIIGELSGNKITITDNSKIETLAKYYITSDEQDVEFENGDYYLKKEKIKLYPCAS